MSSNNRLNLTALRAARYPERWAAIMRTLPANGAAVRYTLGV
jgi:hypothetical protein